MAEEMARRRERVISKRDEAQQQARGGGVGALKVEESDDEDDDSSESSGELVSRIGTGSTASRYLTDFKVSRSSRGVSGWAGS